MASSRYLDLFHFVTRSAGSAYHRPVSLLLACALFGLLGCASEQTPRRTEDSETSGRIRIVCAPDLQALMDREVESFRIQYPSAQIEMTAGDSREGVAALMSRTADLVVAARELEPEERNVVVKGGMEIEGYRFAKDAVCVIVHPANPLVSLSLEDLRRVYLGEVTRWAQVRGSSGDIVPVIPPPASDLMLAFLQRVMGGQPPTAPAVRAETDSAVTRIVGANPNAIGFVSAIHAGSGVKVLRLSSLTGLPDWKPDPEHVYAGDYPLSRVLNLYVRSRGPKLANGLVTYIMSRDGQKQVHEAGFVPTSVPIRFVRRSPMLGSH
jgi:phosphate transport system substrate-binding protein